MSCFLVLLKLRFGLKLLTTNIASMMITDLISVVLPLHSALVLVCAVLVNLLVMLFQISFARELLSTHDTEEVAV